MTPISRPAAAICAALMIMTGGPAAHSQPAEDRATDLSATLTPSGDPNGTGSATVRLRPAVGRVCATISWSRIDRPLAAHIHRSSDGSVVVDLTGAVTGGRRCAAAPRAVIRRIGERPRRYYVNVHNEAYSSGAIQGVLRR